MKDRDLAVVKCLAVEVVQGIGCVADLERGIWGKKLSATNEISLNRTS